MLSVAEIYERFPLIKPADLDRTLNRLIGLDLVHAIKYIARGDEQVTLRLAPAGYEWLTTYNA